VDSDEGNDLVYRRLEQEVWRRRGETDIVAKATLPTHLFSLAIIYKLATAGLGLS